MTSPLKKKNLPGTAYLMSFLDRKHVLSQFDAREIVFWETPLVLWNFLHAPFPWLIRLCILSL